MNAPNIPSPKDPSPSVSPSAAEPWPPPDRLPKHIAIIPDGNGRWARRHNLPRAAGHVRGADVLIEVTEMCCRMGIRWLTVFAFSSENWRRPPEEVALLMQIIKESLVKTRKIIMDWNVRFTSIGHAEETPEDLQAELNETIRMSAGNSGLTLCLALNYGGRQEILDGCRRFALEVQAGKRRPDEATEALLRSYLYDPTMPSPDLMIRTGGELRISNFLLWHIAYSELYVTRTLWPDFSEADLRLALAEYARRERRYGGLSPG